MLDDDHHAVRAAARSALVDRAPGEALELAEALAALGPARARREGIRVLLERREDPTRFALDRDPEVRARALASGRVGTPEALRCLGDPSPPVRAFALESLRDPDAARRFAQDPSVELRIAAARSFGRGADLAPLLLDRSWRVRLAAVLGAEAARDEAALPALFTLLEREPPGRTRARAAQALESLTRAPFGEDAAAWRKWRANQGEAYRFPEPLAAVRREEHSKAAIQFRKIPVLSRRVCFLLDASRSMLEPAPGKKGRTRWDLAREDLLAVVEKLPADARFNVILFRTGVESFRPGLAPVVARPAFRTWIGAQEPRGWTNLFDALRLALSDDEVDALYILTDGVPSTGAETARRAILDEIAYLNRFRLVQVNCVQAGGDEGLGKGWKGFLDELAAAHDGIAVRE